MLINFVLGFSLLYGNLCFVLSNAIYTKNIVCYVTSDESDEVTVGNRDSFLCTHIIWKSSLLDGIHRTVIDGQSFNDEEGKIREEEDILHKLKTQNPDLIIMLAVGLDDNETESLNKSLKYQKNSLILH